MTTNFEHGWRLPAGCDALRVGRNLRVAALAVHQELLTSAVIARAVASLDTATVNGRRRPAQPLLSAFQHLSDLHRADRIFSLEVVFVSDPTEVLDGRERLYALVYDQGHAAYSNIVAAIPGAEPWPYTTTEDRPADLSELQWLARRRTWDRMFPPGTTVAEQGLTFRVVTNDVLDGPEWLQDPADPHWQLQRRLPSVAARATTLGRNELTAQIARDRTITSAEDMVSALRDLAARLPARVSAIANQLAPLTVADLLPDVDPEGKVAGPATESLQD